MRSSLKNILNSLSYPDPGRKLALGQGYACEEISKSSFGPLPDPGRDTVVFIDGGNAQILGGANFSIQLIRTYRCTYTLGTRKAKTMREFLLLVRSSIEQGKLVYTTQVFGDDLSFGSFPITENETRVKPSQIGEYVRKLSELEEARRACNDLHAQDGIILDGDLEAHNDKEWLAFEQAYQRAREKGIFIAGLSKTSHLLTDTGESAVALVHRLMPKGEWIAGPLATSSRKEHQANIFFTKLHKRSDHIFRLDALTGVQASKICAQLSQTARDPSFLGYPYPLLEADKNARVSNQETRYLRMQMYLDAEEALRPYIRGVDAHEILDTIS